MLAKLQPGLAVGVIAELTAEAERVRGNSGTCAVSVVHGAGSGGAGGIQALGHVAALVKGVEGATGGSVPGQKPRPAEGVGGEHIAAAIKFTNGGRAVVEEEGLDAAAQLPRPQAAAGVPCRQRAAKRGRMVLGIIGDRRALVSARVAVAVVDIPRSRDLVVHAKAVGTRAAERGRVACRVVAEAVGIAPAPAQTAPA